MIKFRSDSKVGKCFVEIIKLYENGHSTKTIGKLLNIDPSNICRALRSRNIKLRDHSSAMKNAIEHGRFSAKQGNEHYKWKGGRKTHSNGYILILTPGHHRADNQGYVPEHVLVVEKRIGRLLMKHETVHHKNHIKDDNRPENLRVMTINAHGRMHGREGAKAKYSK